MKTIHPSQLQVGDLFKLAHKPNIVFRKIENKPIPYAEHLFDEGCCYNAEYAEGAWSGEPCCIYDGKKADEVILVDKS